MFKKQNFPHNLNMKSGRFLKIKKTHWLWTCAITFFLSFVALTIYFCVELHHPEMWFFAFCALLGLFQLTKSGLFHLDSTFYGGTLLSLVGASGFVFTFTNTTHFSCCYILGSFSLASFVTFVLYKQKFQLIFSYSLFFVDILTYILLKNLITLPIFIAFLVSFLVLLIVEVGLYFKRG